MTTTWEGGQRHGRGTHRCELNAPVSPTLILVVGTFPNAEFALMLLSQAFKATQGGLALNIDVVTSAFLKVRAGLNSAQ